MKQKAEDFMTALLLACALAVSLGAGVFAIFGAPGGGTAAGVVLVIAPPWGPGAPALVMQAGGRLIGPTSSAFGTFATFEGPAPVARLRTLGAWATRDAQALATICGVRP